MDRLTFAPLLGSPLFVGVFLAILIAGLRCFPLRGVTGSRRYVLLAARGALYFVFALLLLRPTILFHKTVPLPAALMVAVDTSESMSLSCGETTRYEVLRQSLVPLTEKLKRFTDSGNEILAFRFDSHAVPLSTDAVSESVSGSTANSAMIALPEKCEGELTAIGTALPEMLAQNAGKRILGMILLSDGTEHAEITDGEGSYGKTAQDAALRFRDARIPIWPVCFGLSDTKLPRDVSVKELSLPDRVFARDTITISGLIQAVECRGQSIPLTLEIEQPDGTIQAVDQLTVSVNSAQANSAQVNGTQESSAQESSDRELIPFSFKYTPETPGQWKISVRAGEMPNEALLVNNIKSDFIDVVDGGFGILCLEGTTRFEQKFIRLALESSAEVRTDYARVIPDKSVTLTGTNEVQRLAASAASRASLVPELFAPGKYAGYILGDIDSSAFKPEELQALADRVRDGSGLILTAGDRAFSSGGYGQTPLADLFPVTLDPLKRLPPDAEPEILRRQRQERLHPTSIEPTPFGEEHYLTQLCLEARRSRELWQTLPELETVWTFGEVKDGADVLLRGSAPPQSPILITQTVGKGRVALLATDSTWRWSLGGFSDEQKRFWRQLALWCANRDQLRPGELIIQLDRHRFTRSEVIPVRVLYRPIETQLPENLHLDVSIQMPDGNSRPVPLRVSKNENGSNSSSDNNSSNNNSANNDGTLSFSGSITPDIKGDYLLTASVSDKSDPDFHLLGNGRFLVEQYNPELENPEASPETLANMARITSGELLTPEKLSPLLDEILTKGESLTETRQSRLTLYDSWPLFLLFIILLSVEWILRKKWGAV